MNMEEIFLKSPNVMYLLGINILPDNAIRSKAVRRVCRLEETKISVGLFGECCWMAWKAGLFIEIILGQ